MLEKNKTHLKYHTVVRWPGPCRNRSAETLTSRPDLVKDMNAFRIKIENVCRLILKKQYKIDPNHQLTGVSLWFESGQDLYEFIIRQPEFEWEIVSEIGTVNYLTGEYKKYKLIYLPTGITID
jgi:hypothetical protein